MIPGQLAGWVCGPTGSNFSTSVDLMPGVLQLHNVFFVYIRIQDKTLNITIKKVLKIS